MIGFMTQYAKTKQSDWTRETGNLLSTAYKFGLRHKRNGLLYLKLENNCSDHQRELFLTYKSNIEQEMKELWKDVINLLDVDIIPKCKTDMWLCFFHRVKGDFYYYHCLYFSHDRHSKEWSATQCYDSLKMAETFATNLPTTHPIRLSLALSLTNFLIEFLHCNRWGSQVASKAFSDALNSFEDIPESDYEETTVLLQLLRDRQLDMSTSSVA